MAKLILLRHGQSVWNQLNLFTGWVDIPLSEKGIEESFASGRAIKDIPIDVIFTSALIRAQMTAMLAMTLHSSRKVPMLMPPLTAQSSAALNGEVLPGAWAKIYSPKTQADCIPVFPAQELNERMYGELQGLNKDETRQRFGAEQVQIWRRSFDVVPPQGESLAMTCARALPFFEAKILPYLVKGDNVLVVAHGNSLRAIMMKLDHLTKEQVVHLELATGEPIIYDFLNGIFTKQGGQ
jgi:2,3-bisphosphoglycerate-dependent phosphoglycerate mutase